MLSVNAHYDGHNYITEQSVQVKPNQKVIITYLDDVVSAKKKRSLAEIKSYMNALSKSVPNGISTVEYVRKLRRDDDFYITSTITNTEYLVFPYRMQNFSKITAYETFLSDFEFNIVEPNKTVAKQAAKIKKYEEKSTKISDKSFNFKRHLP